MARPKPIILLDHHNSKTHKNQQVLKAEAIYAVFYQKKPINLRVLNNLISYPGPKYKKTAFPEPGHAFNLAEKMNKLFNTIEFEVYKLESGQLCKDEGK